MSARVDRLLKLLPGAGVEAMLVTNVVNVRYLTGYSGSNGIALVGPQIRVFVTDFRYVEQAAEEVDPTFDRRRATQDLLEGAAADALPQGELRLGFEAPHMSVRRHARLRELLDDRIELVPVDGLVERLRAVKEPDEIDRVEAAAALADEAYERVVSAGLRGRTERDVATALDFEMRRQGAKRPSFETIIATGPHGALPHAQPRDVEIRPGEMVVIDWGAELDGYCSDCTRTVAAGDPHASAREIYQLVLDAQLAGVQAVSAGRSGREVDGVARAVIDAAGHGDQFGHGLGHGVGMEVHEGPRLSRQSKDDLRSGNVVTVEPGIYVAGQLGVRIEDLVVVSDNGAQILSSVPKELRVAE
jgi:Xaa-Pro aminopeptidase